VEGCSSERSKELDLLLWHSPHSPVTAGFSDKVTRARGVMARHKVTALIAKDIKDDCAAAYRTAFLNSMRVWAEFCGFP
jgi:hypothetical protein